MSAIFTLKQRNSVHLLCDSASYDRDGVLDSVSVSKCKTLPTINAAICASGPVDIPAILAHQLGQRCGSFDELVENAEEIVRGEFARYIEEVWGTDAASNVWIIGWHEREDRPAIYAIDCWTDDSHIFNEAIEAGEQPRWHLTEDEFGGSPLPDLAEAQAAGYEVKLWDDMIPEIDLLHLAEISRRKPHNGKYLIGGRAVLTSIDRRGVSQRAVHDWGDRAGERISIQPIDWKAWRADKVRKLSAHSAEPMSRLRRDMLERKARKGKLRLV